MLLQRCQKTVCLVYKIVKYIDTFKDALHYYIKIHRVLFKVLVYSCVKLISRYFPNQKSSKYLLKGLP